MGENEPVSAPDPRRVLILGSTGSIGTQALAVIAAHPDRFRVVGLAAGGGRPDLLATQAAAHPAAVVALGSGGGSVPGPDRSGPAGFAGRRLITGPDAATELVESVPADVVLNGITGSVGLTPTLATLRRGTTLALANKESLVAGGSLVTRAAAPGQLVPVDSEHSALAQCLRGGRAEEVAALVLTASGGPFRGRTAAQLAEVTVTQALAHPTWSMGPMVTVNSATLVNKGLELIEAHLLFGVPYERIQTVVHPQSIVHSMVTFTDGATLAQASPPDMALPIALGLGWPERVPGAVPPCDFGSPATWTFEPVDHQAFPALNLARAAGMAGGLLPAVYNAANETAVTAFVSGSLPFTAITSVLAGILEEADDFWGEPGSVADVLAAESWARTRAGELVAGAARAG